MPVHRSSAKTTSAMCIISAPPLIRRMYRYPCALCVACLFLSKGEKCQTFVLASTSTGNVNPILPRKSIFTNKCSSPGCKQKEMIKVTCDQCHLNFCLKHRHPLDHVCAADGKPLSKPGNAAVIRARGNPKPSATPSTSKDTSSSRPNRLNTSAAPLYKSDLPRSIPTSASLQAGLTEEQALQSALERSLAESSRNTAPSRQEQEDLALAQAIAASEEEFRRQQQQTQHRSSRSLPCKLS
ncbi:AN1-type zinc finger protein 2A isoform X2 [Leucoraja erinacea]|uniref:AN1-type zinc finger protein 2A isoform X2 n=1 Tax=Leucoraja erinaceus TaxID=7782 RepID=UPI002457C826|nr:AN1-type zinc finger protein 2A isoform X2 [Leucoraja erinacea]